MKSKINTSFDDMHGGLSDERLETLSQPQAKFESGLAPWATWESENSSFGMAFRKWAKYPVFLPLYFCSDHGVNWGSRCWPNETGSKYRTFFTWNKKKSEMMNKEYGKSSYHVPHPWVFYRKKYFKDLPDERRGTLVFYAHTNDKTTPVYDDLDGYINKLKSLPDKYQPITICLSFHDVNKGVHKELRKYEIPLVTAGATNSIKFIDRFYSLLYQFKYSSSSNIGTHTFYIVEAGIPFFLYGPHPKFKMKGEKYVEEGEPQLSDYGDEEDANEFAKLKQLLSVQEDEVTEEQSSLVSKFLGLDSEMTRFKATLILWRELLLHLNELISVYASIVIRSLSKIKSLIISKEKF